MIKNIVSHLAVFIAVCTAIVLFNTKAYALVVLRDDEIENFLRAISLPVFHAAQLSPDSVSLVLVGDDTINAYVAGGQNIFIYSGLIEKTDNVGELVGVIAHETGHIASGHLVRGQEAMEQASYQAMLSTVLGVAVGVFAGNGEAATGLTLGGSEMARRSFLRNSRTFEASADQAAVTYLHDNHLTAAGLESFLGKLSSQEVLLTSQQDEYVMTHPISQDRIRFIEEKVERETNVQDWPPEIKEGYSRIKAKILAYQHPEQINRVYGASDTMAGNYAKAIAAYRTGDVALAKRLLDSLIEKEPSNPYFSELMGQILFENADIDGAIRFYRKAYDLRPQSGLIAMALGHALLEKNNPETNKEVIGILEKSRLIERHSPQLYRFLSIAYGRSGDNGMAQLYLAEEAMMNRDFVKAGQHAKAAQKTLPEKSSAWYRAEDLIRLVKDTKI